MPLLIQVKHPRRTVLCGRTSFSFKPCLHSLPGVIALAPACRGGLQCPQITPQPRLQRKFLPGGGAVTVKHIAIPLAARHGLPHGLRQRQHPVGRKRIVGRGDGRPPPRKSMRPPKSESTRQRRAKRGRIRGGRCPCRRMLRRLRRRAVGLAPPAADVAADGADSLRHGVAQSSGSQNAASVQWLFANRPAHYAVRRPWPAARRYAHRQCRSATPVGRDPEPGASPRDEWPTGPGWNGHASYPGQAATLAATGGGSEPDRRGYRTRPANAPVPPGRADGLEA